MTKAKKDSLHQGRKKSFMDIDRMVNEGLGGGLVTEDNGQIEQAPEVAKESPPQKPGH